jgi:pimeloyl-ACP methyl ester carboxylesterase
MNFTFRALSAIFAVAFILAASAFARGGTPSFSSDRISVSVTGAGKDVILIAGAGARADEIWAGTTTSVPGYRFHVVQVRGLGGVPPGANAMGSVVVPVAEEVARYIKVARLNRPALVGLSMGGSLVMLVASRHPRLVSRVLVLDMIPFMGLFFAPPGSAVTTESIKPVAERVFKDMLAASPEARRKSMSASVDTMIRTPDLRENVLARGMESDQRVMAQVMFDLIPLDLRQDVSNIKVPLTVLYVHAPLIPWTLEQTDAVYRDTFSNAPGVRLVRIPDSYHFIMLDQPKRFAQELRSFLSGPAKRR